MCMKSFRGIGVIVGEGGDALENSIWKKWVGTAVLAVCAWVPFRLLVLDGFWSDAMLLRLGFSAAGACVALYFRLWDETSNDWKSLVRTFFPFAVVGAFMLLLPERENSQSLDNALYFLPVLLWFAIWYSYSGFRPCDRAKMAQFVRLSGEVLVWFTLFMLGGAVLTALSIGLFEIVGVKAEVFYIQNIATLGACAAPFAALLTVARLPGVRLASILGLLFLPLFLISVTVFGTVAFFADNKP